MVFAIEIIDCEISFVKPTSDSKIKLLYKS